mmetsp:Transcript_25796/g.58047  ORF Transcript_25796/g.58047 Transcript_25796/m.58047 type:complete len:112 (-) Transcript_25796:195-530(-)
MFPHLLITPLYFPHFLSSPVHSFPPLPCSPLLSSPLSSFPLSSSPLLPRSLSLLSSSSLLFSSLAAKYSFVSIHLFLSFDSNCACNVFNFSSSPPPPVTNLDCISFDSLPQ